MFAEQLRRALVIAWLAVSVVVCALLLAPFLLPPATIYALAPVCEWKAKYNRECVFCGMTTSFVAISRGEFHEAARRNQGSIPLYLALVCNECVAAWFALGRLKSEWGRLSWSVEDRIQRRNPHADPKPGVGRARYSRDGGRLYPLLGGH